MRSGLGAWLALTIGLTSVGSAQTQQRDLDIAAARLEGAVFQRGAVVPTMVYRVRPDAPLWVEAESAPEIRRPVSIEDSPEASGGKCATIPDGTFSGDTGGVLMHVHAEDAGEYALWVRTFWPDIGSNSFYLQIDDGERTLLGNDEAPGHIGQWFWLRGPTWRLTAGAHRIAVWWREDGSSLDKLALASRDFAPEGLGPEGASPQLPDLMTVSFPAFRPKQVARWHGLELDASGVVGEPRVVVTDRSGATHEAGPGGSLTHVPVADPAAASVSISVHMKPTVETVLRRATLTYEGAPSTLVLSDEAQSFTFDSVTGRLLQITDLQAGDEILAASSGLPFRLQVHDHATGELKWLPDEAVALLSCDAPGEAPRAATFTWRVDAPAGQCNVVCRLELPGDGAMPQWSIGVANRGQGFDIVDVEFPVVDQVALGQDPRDDWLTWPYWLGGGQIIPDPSTNGPGSGMYCSGRCMMHWLDVYEKGDGARGLYLASLDDTFLAGRLVAEANPSMGGVRLATSKMPRIEPGQTWASESYVCGLHRGDWHHAADLYREWFGARVPYDPPRWAQESDGWLGRGRGTNFLQDIPTHFRAAKNLGLDYVEFWGQMMVGREISAGGCNRLYFPDPRYGSEDEFARAIGYVRQAGGHIGFYTNGQAWNPRYPALRQEYERIFPEGQLVPDWDNEFHRYGVIRADGGYVPQYAPPANDPYPGSFFLMCPATEGWPRYLHHYIARKYAQTYGVDAMYVDQVGAATAQPCFARDHLHQEIGAWTRGHRANFARIKRDARQTAPDFALATEGFGDAYRPDVDIFLIAPASATNNAYAYPGLLRYTFPDAICFDGFANGNVGHRPNEDVLDDVFLVGTRFDMWPRGDEAMAYFARLLRLRQEIGPLLYPARYMDDIDLEAPQGIHARWFALDPDQADGVLVTMLNREAIQGASVRLKMDLPEKPRAFMASLDRPLSPCEFRAINGGIEINVPPERASAILVLGEALMSPPAIFRLDTPVGAVGGSSIVTLRYRPLADFPPSKTEVLLELPDGWRADAAYVDLSCACDVPLRLTPPADALRQGYPICASVAIPGHAAAESRGSILLHDAFSVDLALLEERVQARIRSFLAEPVDGTCTLQAPEWLELGRSEADFHLEHGGEALISFDIARAPKLTERGRVEATVSAGRATGAGSLDLAPPSLHHLNWQRGIYDGEPTLEIVSPGLLEETFVVRTSSVGHRGAWQWRSEMLLPGTKWTFRGQVRTEALDTVNGGARVRVICFDRRNPIRGTMPTIYTDFVSGTTDWHDFELTFTVPAGTGRVQFELFNWHAAGTSYWRNLTLE